MKKWCKKIIGVVVWISVFTFSQINIFAIDCSENIATVEAEINVTDEGLAEIIMQQNAQLDAETKYELVFVGCDNCNDYPVLKFESSVNGLMFSGIDIGTEFGVNKTHIDKRSSCFNDCLTDSDQNPFKVYLLEGNANSPSESDLEDGCYIGNISAGDAIKIQLKECVTNNGEDGILTSLGCVPYKSGGLIAWLLKYGISIGGGIAFLLMAWGAFLFSTSNGDQEKVKQGKEIITSALAGLIFIIFSVFLLNIIGVQIFKIPGFSS